MIKYQIKHQIVQDGFTLFIQQPSYGFNQKHINL
jgi:hypothetical protein